MKGVVWKFTFLLAISFAVVLADSPDLKPTSKSADDAEENTAAKSGSAVNASVEESESKRSWGNKPEEITVVGNGNLNYPQQLVNKFPDHNEYEYLSDSAFNSSYRQPTSKLVPQSELVYAHNIPGASNSVTCSREGDLYNLWTPSHQCLVCACVRQQGWLRAVCASCSGCYTPENIRNPTPKPFFPTERPTAPPSLAPIEEEVTCKPLPSGQPFENPLHPCQVCVCYESLDGYGRADVQIKCQENPQCVLPTDLPPMPPIPDEPVPSAYCDKFPTNVVFPHPSNNCRSCHCSVQISHQGIPEKLLVCVTIPECKQTDIDIIITEKPEVYPYVTPAPEPSWAPVTLRPAPPGPLPGPSPHDSCKPYAPSHPFQHPWDECQVCVCMEAYSAQHINIEIMCYTKLSCCIEPPFDLAPSSIPLVTIPQPAKGKIRIQDAVCELKTFGVEFVHPNDPCKICTCELQGLVISSVCRRSYSPACSPPYSENHQGTANMMANGAIAYGSSQNKGSIRLGPPGATLTPVEWKTARPGLTMNPQQMMINSNKQVLVAQNGQNIQRPGVLNHDSGYQSSAGAYAQGYQVVPNAYSPQGYHSGQAHPGFVHQSASSVSSSAAGYHSLPYLPAHQQYPARRNGGQLFAPGGVSVAAQANAQAMASLRPNQAEGVNEDPSLKKESE